MWPESNQHTSCPEVDSDIYVSSATELYGSVNPQVVPHQSHGFQAESDQLFYITLFGFLDFGAQERPIFLVHFLSIHYYEFSQIPQFFHHFAHFLALDIPNPALDDPIANCPYLSESCQDLVTDCNRQVIF